MPLAYFYTPENIKKLEVFLMFSRFIEIAQWNTMGKNIRVY